MELEGFGDPTGFFDFVHAPFKWDNVEGTDFLDTQYYRSVPLWIRLFDGLTLWTTGTGNP